MNKTDKKKTVKDILIKINPEIESVINNKKINLINDGLIDSFDIIKIIVEIDKINKKKINPNKVDDSTFSNVEQIAKLLQ